MLRIAFSDCSTIAERELVFSDGKLVNTSSKLNKTKKLGSMLANKIMQKNKK